MQHHAFVIEAEAEAGIETAQAWVERELSMQVKGNPDVVVLRHGLLSVEDVRGIVDSAAQAPFRGDKKVIIITASRAYHEAQNALLKLFEEPPPGTYLFLILPTLGGLLPTLRSRIATIEPAGKHAKPSIPEEAVRFMQASRDKRSALIKKLASGKDEDERRARRDEAIRIVNGIEAAAYGMLARGEHAEIAALLSDIAVLRGNLYDRSAPLRMILEHVSLVLPKHFSIEK